MSEYCPFCDRLFWYYDPFVRKWKCQKCLKEHESVFGNKFCYFCGENISNQEYSIKREKGRWVFYHKECINKTDSLTKFRDKILARFNS